MGINANTSVNTNSSTSRVKRRGNANQSETTIGEDAVTQNANATPSRVKRRGVGASGSATIGKEEEKPHEPTGPEKAAEAFGQVLEAANTQQGFVKNFHPAQFKTMVIHLPGYRGRLKRKQMKVELTKAQAELCYAQDPTPENFAAREKARALKIPQDWRDEITDRSIFDKFSFLNWLTRSSQPTYPTTRVGSFQFFKARYLNASPYAGLPENPMSVLQHGAFMSTTGMVSEFPARSIVAGNMRSVPSQGISYSANGSEIVAYRSGNVVNPEFNFASAVRAPSDGIAGGTKFIPLEPVEGMRTKLPFTFRAPADGILVPKEGIGRFENVWSFFGGRLKGARNVKAGQRVVGSFNFYPNAALENAPADGAVVRKGTILRSASVGVDAVVASEYPSIWKSGKDYIGGIFRDPVGTIASPTVKASLAKWHASGWAKGAGAAGALMLLTGTWSAAREDGDRLTVGTDTYDPRRRGVKFDLGEAMPISGVFVPMGGNNVYIPHIGYGWNVGLGRESTKNAVGAVCSIVLGTGLGILLAGICGGGGAVGGGAVTIETGPGAAVGAAGGATLGGTIGGAVGETVGSALGYIGGSWATDKIFSKVFGEHA